MKRSLMVPGSLSSALQTTNFSVPGRLAGAVPLDVSGEAGAAHAAEAAVFEGIQDAVVVATRDEFAHRCIAAGFVRVGVAFEVHPRSAKLRGR